MKTEEDMYVYVHVHTCAYVHTCRRAHMHVHVYMYVYVLYMYETSFQGNVLLCRLRMYHYGWLWEGLTLLSEK